MCRGVVPRKPVVGVALLLRRCGFCKQVFEHELIAADLEVLEWQHPRKPRAPNCVSSTLEDRRNVRGSGWVAELALVYDRPDLLV